MLFSFLKNRGTTSIICMFLAFGFAFLGGCTPKNPKTPLQKIEGIAQGSYYQISYYGTNKQNLQSSIDSILQVFDMCASLWQDSSLISKVNRGEKVVLDSMFIDMFNKSCEISELTDGAFDITVGPLVQAYGFSKGNGKGAIFSAAKLDSLLANVGWKKIHIVNQHLIKEVPNMKIDFNAIAQGYCADLIGKYLESRGIDRYLVDIGGEITAKGVKDNGEAWTIGIEKPAPNAGANPAIFTKLHLENLSLVTSGNYRKYFEINGKRYSHTIDPTTGCPIKHGLLSASVICKEAWKADALATAFMVMGVEKTQNFIKLHPEYEVFLIYSNNENSHPQDSNKGFQTWSSKGFKTFTSR